MRGVDGVVRVEGVSRGQEPAIAEAGLPVRLVLERLAFASDDEMTRELGARLNGADPTELSLEAVRAAAAYGASLARDKKLSPQREKVFSNLRSISGRVRIEEVRRVVVEVLQNLGDGISRDRLVDVSPDLSPELVSAALLYGAALVGEERFPPLVAEPASERYLRALLPSHDQELIEDCCQMFGNELTLEQQFTAWIEYVLQVEGGYDDSFDEYVYDLWRRDRLEDLLSLISPTGQALLRPILLPWDKRFEAVTETVAYPLMGSGGRWEGRRWQWYRVPVRRGRSLEQHLSGLGNGLLEATNGLS
jgi:uncharacterized protein (DUF433 family)